MLVAPVTAGGQRAAARRLGSGANIGGAPPQSIGTPGQVVISGQTAALVAGFFNLEPLGTLTLKGIGQPVPAFRVLGRSGAQNRLEARPLSEFVPRAAAADWLGDPWSEAGNGSGRLVAVPGEPGIGKSRSFAASSAKTTAQKQRVVTLACTDGDP